MGKRIEQEYFDLRGGLDDVSPYLRVGPGRAIEAVNYVALPKGGYQRIKGYKKVDGRAASPQAAAGSGDILGVWMYKGKKYCVRNNAGGTAAVLFKENATTGWTAVAMPTILKYDGGSTEFVEGETITGGTSAATAVVRRVVQSSGVYGSSTVTGLLVVTNVVGTFQDNEALLSGATNRAVADGTTTTYALPAGGEYRFVNHNFYAGESTEAMYGVNGVGDPFEWDDTYFVPLRQAVTTSYPTTIEVHRKHLFLGYARGSTVNSGTGDPRSYLAADGAFEIGWGDAITDLFSTKGGVLVVGCEKSTHLLYGVDKTDFEPKKFTDHGVREDTVAEIGGTIVALDENGLQSLTTSQAFGDFAATLLSYDVNERLRGLFESGTAPRAEVSQNSDQYRLFFGEKGLIATFNGSKLAGIMPVVLNHPVRCICRGQNASGVEELIFGSSDGNVFQMDSTNFFDGTAVTGVLRLPFNFAGQPRRRKQFRKAFLDMQVEGAAVQLNGAAEYDFALEESTRDIDQDFRLSGGGSWNVSYWNDFNWSSPFYSDGFFELDGIGQNMSLVIHSDGSEDAIHTIFGVTLHYSERRLMR